MVQELKMQLCQSVPLNRLEYQLLLAEQSQTLAVYLDVSSGEENQRFSREFPESVTGNDVRQLARELRDEIGGWLTGGQSSAMSPTKKPRPLLTQLSVRDECPSSSADLASARRALLIALRQNLPQLRRPDLIPARIDLLCDGAEVAFLLVEKDAIIGASKAKLEVTWETSPLAIHLMAGKLVQHLNAQQRR